MSSGARILQLARTCVLCHVCYYIDVRAAGYEAWQHGALIQDALPELEPDDRELLISGVCGDCFDGMFADYPTTPEPRDDADPR